MITTVHDGEGTVVVVAVGLVVVGATVVVGAVSVVVGSAGRPVVVDVVLAPAGFALVVGAPVDVGDPRRGGVPGAVLAGPVGAAAVLGVVTAAVVVAADAVVPAETVVAGATVVFLEEDSGGAVTTAASTVVRIVPPSVRSAMTIAPRRRRPPATSTTIDSFVVATVVPFEFRRRPDGAPLTPALSSVAAVITLRGAGSDANRFHRPGQRGEPLSYNAGLGAWEQERHIAPYRLNAKVVADGGGPMTAAVSQSGRRSRSTEMGSGR